MLSTALRNYLKADPTLADLVGEEIYPYALGERATFPAVSFFEVTAEVLEDMTGPTGQKVGRWQFSAWSGDDEEAARVREAIKDRLLFTSGEIGAAGISPPTTGVQVGHIARPRDFTLRDPEDGKFQCVVDVDIFYEGES